jgi:hypothetical protein
LLRAIPARSAALWTERSVPFGMYWRRSPLVFKFDLSFRRCAEFLLLESGSCLLICLIKCDGRS